MLVVLGLLVPVTALVLALSPLGGLFWQQSAAQAEAYQHVRVGLDELVHELQYAYTVSVDNRLPVIVYQKKASGEHKLYRVYLSGKQLMLDLPEGTAVPLAGCIDGLRAEPEGLLPAGRSLTLIISASQGGHPVELQSSVLPRNRGVEQ